MSTTKTFTDDELMRLPRDGKYELVHGELIRMSPAGGRHGRICLRLGARLLAFVEEKRIGMVFESSTGFRMPGGNLRCPDISFVATDRLPSGDAPMGFLKVAPDLAVEVLSPSDRPGALSDRVAEYLENGTRLVWVIDPDTRTATIHGPNAATRQVSADGELLGEEVLPAFRCRLADLFA